jgi:hypothetical protein
MQGVYGSFLFRPAMPRQMLQTFSLVLQDLSSRIRLRGETNRQVVFVTLSFNCQPSIVPGFFILVKRASFHRRTIFLVSLARDKSGALLDSLAGHSRGGKVAVALARKLLGTNVTINALIALDPVDGPKDPIRFWDFTVCNCRSSKGLGAKSDENSFRTVSTV